MAVVIGFRVVFLGFSLARCSLCFLVGEIDLGKEFGVFF